MGSDQSRTRKLTVENDDPTSVIKVSDAVVQRLRTSQRGVEKAIESQTPVPPSQYSSESGATSLQLRQAHVADLKKNDQYWRDRLKKLQEGHSRVDAIIEQECKTAVEESKRQQSSGKSPIDLPPCDESEKAVLGCYKSNPNESMKCASIVEAFQKCVDSQRQRVLTNRG